MENYCWVCETKITTENISEEHIIPNSCGGRLKSKDLVCTKCNNQFGQEIDAEFARQLSPFVTLLNIKKQRGKNQPLKGKDSSGTEYVLKAGKVATPELAKPNVNIEDIDKGKKISIRARNEKEAIQILTNINKKHANLTLDIEECMQNATKTDEYLEEPIMHEIVVGGELAFKSICKTAVNFFIFNGGQREYIKHLIPYLQEKDKQGSFVWHYFPETPVYDKKMDEISHVIHINGNKEQGILYSYIEFFNTYCFIVKLNDNYTGPDCHYTYIYEVLEKKEISIFFQTSLNKKDIENIFLKKKNSSKDIKRRLMNILVCIDKIQTQNRLSAIIEDALDKTFGYKGGIAKEKIPDFISNLLDEFMPFYIHLQSKGK